MLKEHTYPTEVGSHAAERSLGRGGTLGVLFGIVIGAAAGLIGVGGGEFRIPVLLLILRLPVKEAAGANTVIGLIVVVLSVIRRWGHQRLTPDDLTLGAVMAVASIFGATIGARKAHKLPTPLLKKVVCLYLLVVGAWMVVEGLAESEHSLIEPSGWIRWTLAALVGFFIAAASGALGVAGGEMRIPALMHLFAVPVKAAGTISLIASIPTVAAGAFTYRRLGHIPSRVMVLSLLMGGGSILGVFVGASFLPLVDKHTLKTLLGLVLLVAAVCMLPGRFNRRNQVEPPPVKYTHPGNRE
ncbi:MAG: sulfite exporter TauE/SafE family protein [Fimbriimonadales bacterium]